MTMTPDLSRAAALAANWVSNNALEQGRNLHRSERLAKAQTAHDTFVAACEKAGSIENLPRWVMTIMRKSGAIPVAKE